MERVFIPLVNNHIYEIVLYKQKQILGLSWHEPPSTEEYKKGTLAFMEAVHQYQVKKILTDCSHRGNPMPEELLWLTHTVMPFFCEEGIQKFAFVVPKDPDHARNLECCLMETEASYQVQFFYSSVDALSWLQGASLTEQAVA